MLVLWVGYRLHRYLKSEKPTLDCLILLQKLCIVKPFDRSIGVDWKLNLFTRCILDNLVKAAIVT